MTHEQEIAQIVGEYAVGAWPAQTKTFLPVTYMLYARALAPFPTEAIKMAMEQLAYTSKFWPTIAEIVETIRTLQAAARGEHIPDASEAWAEIEMAVKKYHVYATPKFSTAEIELAAKRYGWADLCNLPADQAGIARAQIMRIYTEIIEQNAERHRMEYALSSATAEQRMKIAGSVKLIADIAEAKKIS